MLDHQLFVVDDRDVVIRRAMTVRVDERVKHCAIRVVEAMKCGVRRDLRGPRYPST